MGLELSETERYLASLEGRLESSGSFTIDTGRQRAVMVEVNRAVPHAYLVKLLQTAIALSGDRRIEVQRTGTSLELRFSPRTVGALEPVRDSLLAVAPGPLAEHWQRYLRQAMMLLLGRSDLRLEVFLGASRLACAEGETAISSCDHHGRGLLRVTALRRRPQARLRDLESFDWKSPRATLQWPEWERARSSLLAPDLDLRDNGVRVNLFPDPWLITTACDGACFNWRFETEYAWAERAAPDFPRRKLWQHALARNPPGPDSSLAIELSERAFSRGACYRLVRGSSGAPRRWLFLAHGFVIDAPLVSSHLPAVEAFVDASDLDLDATFLRPVRNERWLALTEQVEADTRQLLLACRERLDPARARLLNRRASRALLDELQKSKL